MKKNFIYVIFIFSFTLPAFAQNLSTEGDDFWVTFMENWLQDPDNPVMLEIYISAIDTTHGTIEIPGFPDAFPPLDFTVTPETALIIPIPTDLAMLTGTNRIQNKGIHIQTDKDVSVYAMNKRQYSADMTVVLPTYSLGNDYFVMSHWEDDNRDNNAHSDSEFAIVATEDNTEISITPSVQTLGYNLPGEAFTITLNKGQCYQVQASAELTGTRVSAVKNAQNLCNHFAVFGGNKYTKIGHCDNPNGHDHLFSQMYPVKTWGKNYTSVNFLSRSGGDYIKVMAGYDSTTIKINNTEILNGGSKYFNAGDYYAKLLDGVNTFSADKPVSVGQFSRSMACDNSRGDPFLIMLNPDQQVLQEVTFYAPSIATISNYDLSIVAETSDTVTVILDDKSISSAFRPVPGNENYSYGRLLINGGNHTLKSAKGIIAYVYGYGVNESFGYATGAGLGNINLAIDLKTPDGDVLPADSVCHETPFLFTINTGLDYNQFHWDFGDGNMLVSGSEDSVPYQYDKAGKYIVTLTAVANEDGCIGAEEQSVKVVKVLNPKATITGPRSVCPNTDSVFYRVKEKYPYYYSWVSEGGEIASGNTGDSIFVNWRNPDNDALLELTATDNRGCMGDPFIKNVKVKDQLDPDAPEGPDSLCSDAIKNIGYSVFDIPGTKNLWYIDNGTIDSSANDKEIAANWNSDGYGRLWYLQKSIIDTVCSGISDTLLVYIQRKPEEFLNITVVNDTFEIDEPVVFYPETDSLFSFINWDFGNDSSLDLFPVSLAPETKYRCSGNYNISAFTTDTAGLCNAQVSAIKSIVIRNPSAEIVNITHEDFINDRLFINWVPFSSTYTKPYFLYRSENGNSWKTIDTLAFPATESVDSAVESVVNVYAYRLMTNFDCPDPVKSAEQNSILLNVEDRNNMAGVSWNDYLNWKYGVKYYEVWLKLDETPFKQIAVVNSPAFEDTIKNDGFEHCFAVKAIENGGNNSYAWSNTACVTLAPEVYPYNVITPNNDGMNESFIIENVEFYPNSLLTIFNRWGKKLVQFRGYQNNWGGMVNGEVLPATTYYYDLDLNDDRARRKNITGMLTILR